MRKILFVLTFMLAFYGIYKIYKKKKKRYTTVLKHE